MTNKLEADFGKIVARRDAKLNAVATEPKDSASTDESAQAEREQLVRDGQVLMESLAAIKANLNREHNRVWYYKSRAKINEEIVEACQATIAELSRTVSKLETEQKNREQEIEHLLQEKEDEIVETRNEVEDLLAQNESWRSLY